MEFAHIVGNNFISCYCIHKPFVVTSVRVVVANLNGINSSKSSFVFHRYNLYNSAIKCEKYPANYGVYFRAYAFCVNVYASMVLSPYCGVRVIQYDDMCRLGFSETSFLSIHTLYLAL